ncbi:Transcriptional Coactivator p15 (PC4) [Diaporthe australafricana]|uniref:Transcriptional Coactivator p15 (PC4) n=1 Tax=Diaporthe australafricana TaxID=127596 RepID=A0ABR3W507_9PEZI
MGKRSSSFVVDDNSSGDERPAKVSKKVKKGSSSKNGTEVDDEGNTFWDVSSLPANAAPKMSHSPVDANSPICTGQVINTAVMKLSGKRRITVQQFKGTWFVNLREYYEDKSGEMKPGRKVSQRPSREQRVLYADTRQGIALSIEQYQTFVGAVPAITKELRKNGVKVADADAAGDDAEEEQEEEEDAKPAKSKKKESKSKKANIEATSDEAEDSE